MLDVVILTIVTVVIVVSMKKIFSIRNQDRRIRGDLELCNGASNRFCGVSERLNEHDVKKGIISISLFGKLNDPVLYTKYIEPLLENARDIKNYLPGWYLRIYLAPSVRQLVTTTGVPKTILQTFLDYDCEVFVMEHDPKDFEASMWRFLPAGEDVTFICMDADFKLEEPGLNNFQSFRDNIAKWLCSGKKFFQRAFRHINVFIPISAGMWGGTGKPIPDIREKIEKYCANWFGCDEAFLTKEVYPLFQSCGVYRAGARAEISMYVFFTVIVFVFLNVVAWRITKRFKTSTSLTND
jgi:hypothetical protein